MSHASSYHSPVMVEEALRFLAVEDGGVYVDGTLGGGGHAEAILEASSSAAVIGVDRDPEALDEAGKRLARFGERVRLVNASYADVVEAADLAVGSVHGVLLDLGISSHQIDEVGRGFTFREGAPLDMRMGRGAGGEATAADLLNSLSEEELARIFRRYGEERRGRRLAREVATERIEAPFSTSDDLVRVIERVLPRPTIQDRARIFQALRIAVNGEIEALEAGLPRLRDVLVSGGVMVVLSYHSLEDRVVKESFREWSRACVCPPQLPVCVCGGVARGESLTRKPLFASEAEVDANPRARSARLRAWRRA